MAVRASGAVRREGCAGVERAVVDRMRGTARARERTLLDLGLDEGGFLGGWRLLRIIYREGEEQADAGKRWTAGRHIHQV